MSEEEIEELIEYNLEYLEAVNSEEIFGGDYTSAVDLKYANKTIERLQQENKELQERINKAIEYLRSNYIEVLKYHDIPSETTSYEIVTVDLLKILKGED